VPRARAVHPERLAHRRDAKEKPLLGSFAQFHAPFLVYGWRMFVPLIVAM
jgi:hypothetical protein